MTDGSETTRRRTRVFVADGHAGYRDGMARLLEDHIEQRVRECRTRGRVSIVADFLQLELEPIEQGAPRLVRLARVVLEAIVESSIAECRGVGRVSAKVRFPVGVCEAIDGGRGGCGRHAVMLATATGHWTTPMNSIVAIIRSRTARFRS